jgi:protein-L-isoaspartate(D-aspartate) O-methyltransferase
MSIDFEMARTKMVDNQIRTTDVTAYEVIDAFLSVPRERFVPARLRDLAYIDNDIEIAPAEGGHRARYLMEPSPLAKLVQLADVRKEDVVLEVGCGTGYGSAILSLLAASVVSLESDESLAAKATETLTELGYDNVAVVTGPLADGYPPEAPYDVMLVSGAVEYVPDAILSQLRDGGRLVVVEGSGNASRAKLYRRDDGITSDRAVFNTSVKALPGFEHAETFVF